MKADMRQSKVEAIDSVKWSKWTTSTPPPPFLLLFLLLLLSQSLLWLALVISLALALAFAFCSFCFLLYLSVLVSVQFHQMFPLSRIHHPPCKPPPHTQMNTPYTHHTLISRSISFTRTQFPCSFHENHTLINSWLPWKKKKKKKILELLVGIPSKWFPPKRGEI